MGSHMAVICCVLQGKPLLRAADGRLWSPGHSVDIGPCLFLPSIFPY